MKRVSRMAGLMLLLAGTCAAGPALCAEPAGRAAFDLQGHRGARGLAPENTLAGFARALAVGVSTLELDCGVTKDGVVVVSHDRLLSPDHTRDRGRKIPGNTRPGDRRPHLRGTPSIRRRAHQAGERVRGGLPRATAVDGERIPRLADVFALVERSGNRTVRFNIETKIDPARPGADRVAAGLRAGAQPGDPRRRHGAARDGAVLRLAHAAPARCAGTRDRARRADRPAAGRGHDRDRQARRLGLARRARRRRSRRVGAESSCRRSAP